LGSRDAIKEGLCCRDVTRILSNVLFIESPKSDHS
jgi:hypothetical protein